jgi:ATP-dependent Clp protease ATP-binding subunit ClpB
MKAKWQSEKEAIEKMRTAKAELEQLRLLLDQARNAGDLGKASEIQYGPFRTWSSASRRG